MVKPTPLSRRSPPYYKSSVEEVEPRSTVVSNMPSGQRILRAVISVGLVLLLIIVVHTGVLYPRGQCLVSLDMGQEPIGVDQLQVDVKEKVDLYSHSFIWELNIGKYLSCRNVLMQSMLKQLSLQSWKIWDIKLN